MAAGKYIVPVDGGVLPALKHGMRDVEFVVFHERLVRIGLQYLVAIRHCTFESLPEIEPPNEPGPFEISSSWRAHLVNHTDTAGGTRPT